jgi:hypothetical protein
MVLRDRDGCIVGVGDRAFGVVFPDYLVRPEPDASDIRKHRLPRHECARDAGREPERKCDNVGVGGVGHPECIG